ncbi:rolling circle replication-associated protein [Dyella sp. 2RAB6]|uniref:rolling circle replication-associated protein n=1 Tax=Dyella sp. 2RAB6 TaxID=3232992 RepID=UPI003F9165A7
MLTAADLSRVDREISFLRRAPYMQWGKVPDFVPARDLVPASAPIVLEGRAETAYDAAQHARRVTGALDYVQQQNALDAPFAQIAKARATGKKGEAHQASPARSAGDALGLVSNATKWKTAGETSEGRQPREKLLINRDAQRVKRMRTAVGHAARLLHFDAHMERHAQRWNMKLITLTYAKVDGWRPGHFAAFRDNLRKWCQANGVHARWVWVAELQERGALHYHIIVWLPKGKFIPTPDKVNKHHKWWPHGQTNVKTAHSAVSYIAKYASKTTAGQAGMYPRGARMHGCGGLDREARRHIRYWQAPFWVRDALTGRADIRKVSGGYMDRFTGEFLASPWRVCIGPGREVWAYRIDQPTETIQ